MAKESKSKVSRGKKPTNIGKELVRRTQDLNRNIETIMGKSAKTESLPISDGLVMYLYDAGDTGNKYVRLDFNDYSSYKDFCMVMNRSTLRGMAEFILNYLENN